MNVIINENGQIIAHYKSNITLVKMTEEEFNKKASTWYLAKCKLARKGLNLKGLTEFLDLISGRYRKRYLSSKVMMTKLQKKQSQLNAKKKKFKSKNHG